MANLFSSIHSFLGESLRKSTRARRVNTAIGHSEMFEQRLLLTTAFDGHWELVFENPSDAPLDDPGPYSMDINSALTSSKSGHISKAGNFGFVHIPGEGSAAFKKLKIKGDTLKGKVRSGDLKANITATGVLKDPDTDNQWKDIKVVIELLSPVITMGPLNGSR